MSLNQEDSLKSCEFLYENMSESEKERFDHIIQMLPILTDKLKKEGNTYIEEFRKILDIFKKIFEVFLFYPNKKIKGLHEFILFFAGMSKLFNNELDFFGKNLIKVLSENYLIIQHDTRLKIIEALSIMCKMNTLPVVEIIPLFFNLLKCQDKILRKKLTGTITTIIVKLNEKHKNIQVNKFLQNYVEKLLIDPNKKLARKTLNIIVNLYKKNVWNDKRTINLISEVCVNSQDIKMCSAGCQFFLSGYCDVSTELSSSEEDAEIAELRAKLRRTKGSKVKAARLLRAAEKKQKRTRKVKFTESFMPIDMLNDPMGFCEGLLKKFSSLSSGNFKHKLIILRLLGRVLGRHNLILPNFFNTIISLMRVDQKEIYTVLSSLIESCHDQIPPSIIDNVINKLFDVFISDIFPAKQITLGLTTLSRIVDRCPYILSDKYITICEDLRKFKNKSVANAAKNVVNLYKTYYEKGENCYGFGYFDSKADGTIKGIELLKKIENKPKEYRMEYEEILDQNQLRKLKALNLKYAVDEMQHKKTNLKELINDGELADNEESEGEDIEIDDNEELEEIEDDNEDNEDNENNDGNEKEDEEVKEEEEEEEEEGDDDDNEEEEEEKEEIKLDEDDYDLINEEENDGNVHGFIENPEELDAYRKTRRERLDDLKQRGDVKEKFVINRKRKREDVSKTNQEKLKNKPMSMLVPKKRLQSKINSDKVTQLNRRIRNLKQQFGKFKKNLKSKFNNKNRKNTKKHK